jgi:putative transposase
LEVDRSRFGDREGSQRGDLTGPNPTDRAKSGTKRHILTDAAGIPLGIVISGANVPDMRMALTTVDDATRRALGRGRPINCCLDKGYDYPNVDVGFKRRGIVAHIRRRGEEARPCRRGKARRWVVERTNGWHNRFRGLLIRWERKSENYLGLVHLACGLICFNQATGNTFRF